MKRLAEWLRGVFPRRRLRSWRYVSPRRRGVGVLALLVLASAFSVYWFLTNDSQIRQQARTYLAEMTGGDWQIERAHFSLFGGIELRGVELHAAGQEKPFFRAERVHLRHHPWSLLARQQLDVRQITCEGGVVRPIYDVPTRSFVYPKLRFSMGGGAAGPHGPGAWWPPMVVEQAKVLITYRGARTSVDPPEMEATIAGVSREGNLYDISLAADDKGSGRRVQGAFSVNMFTGEIASVAGIEVQDVSLLEQFHALENLGIHGRLTVTGRWDPQSGRGFLDANLDDASMDLPPEMGGLGLRAARGQLHVDANGILVRGLSGQLRVDANGVLAQGLLEQGPRAAASRVSVSGLYAGFEANSPFDFHVEVQGLSVSTDTPGQGPAATGPATGASPVAATRPGVDEGPLARVVGYVREHYPVKGKLDSVSMRLARGADGKLTVEGNAVAANLVTMDRSFPYELRNTRVNVQFTDRWLEFHQLAGTHGSARIEVSGRVRFPPEGKTYDLRVRAREVPVDPELYAALSAEQRQMWDAVRPTGKIGANVRVHVDIPGEAEKQEVTLLMDGAASVEYEGFPYRLESVYGEVQLGERDIAIHSLSGKGPRMTCTVAGAVHLDANFRGEANLVVTADLPLDQRLENALGRQGRASFQALRPGGRARNVLAKIWRRPGEDPRFHVTTELVDGSFTFDRFPYAVTDAGGLLVLEPNQVTILGIAARHMDTPITMRGTVSYGTDRVGIDLEMDANSMQADQELFQAVPPAVQRVWRQLSPTGLADVGLRLHWDMADDANAPVDPNDMDYVCRIQARDMGLKYMSFPYALGGVSGLAIVTPGRVELRGVTAADGKMKLWLDGNVTAGENEDRAELSLRAEDMPLDSALLSALPLQAVPIFGRLKPGGSCNLNLSRLVLVSSASGAASAAPPARGEGVSPLRPEGILPSVASSSSSGPAAATGPLAPLEGPVTDWLLEGEMSLKDADVDLGMPAKLTGGLWGRIARTREGLRIDANLLLGSLWIGQRVISDVRGRMTKDANSALIHVDDIVGKAYGGRLAGFAEVRLGDVPQYGLRIFAEGMNLSDIFNAAVTDANERVAVEGLLDATVEVKAVGGAKPVRHVSGLLHLTKAKTRTLPVLVDRLQPVFLSLPEGTFSEGVAEYTLQEGKVLFREIHLVGPGIAIVGSGTMNLKNDALRLTFLSRPGLVPRMDNLADELIGGLLRELVEIQVTGTLKKPRFRSVPLRGVDAIVKKLLNPDAE